MLRINKNLLSYIFFFFISAVFLFPAENNPAVPETAHKEKKSLSDDPSALLGLTLEEAYALFGVPDEVATHRDRNPDFDNIVFFYKKMDLSLFWFENRVWVVRLDSRSPMSIFGVSAGMKKDEVLKILKYTYQEIDGSLVFFLHDRGFPVRLRLYFIKDVLSDIYLYRGDF